VGIAEKNSRRKGEKYMENIAFWVLVVLFAAAFVLIIGAFINETYINPRACIIVPSTEYVYIIDTTGNGVLGGDQVRKVVIGSSSVLDIFNGYVEIMEKWLEVELLAQKVTSDKRLSHMKSDKKIQREKDRYAESVKMAKEKFQELTESGKIKVRTRRNVVASGEGEMTIYEKDTYVEIADLRKDSVFDEEKETLELFGSKKEYGVTRWGFNYHPNGVDLEK
jgi:hypothetical protein